jgi:hypothetical protein
MSFVIGFDSTRPLTILQASRSSGFGPLHEVLMNLCAKTIFTGRWGAVVTPSNDNELVESKTARKTTALIPLYQSNMYF